LSLQTTLYDSLAKKDDWLMSATAKSVLLEQPTEELAGVSACLTFQDALSNMVQVFNLPDFFLSLQTILYDSLAKKEDWNLRTVVDGVELDTERHLRPMKVFGSGIFSTLQNELQFAVPCAPAVSKLSRPRFHRLPHLDASGAEQRGCSIQDSHSGWRSADCCVVLGRAAALSCSGRTLHNRPTANLDFASKTCIIAKIDRTDRNKLGLHIHIM